MNDVLRIANCSGFFGDRLSAAKEMVEGGPIDVLTGDYLAELTMSIVTSGIAASLASDNADALTAVLGRECIGVCFVCEGECSGGAAVKGKVLRLLHFVHVHSFAIAGVDATPFYEPRALGLYGIAGRIIMHGDQLELLVLLIRLSNCAVRTADLGALSINLRCDAEILVQGTQTISAFLRLGMKDIMHPCVRGHGHHCESNRCHDQ